MVGTNQKLFNICSSNTISATCEISTWIKTRKVADGHWKPATWHQRLAISHHPLATSHWSLATNNFNHGSSTRWRMSSWGTIWVYLKTNISKAKQIKNGGNRSLVKFIFQIIFICKIIKLDVHPACASKAHCWWSMTSRWRPGAGDWWLIAGKWCPVSSGQWLIILNMFERLSLDVQALYWFHVFEYVLLYVYHFYSV